MIKSGSRMIIPFLGFLKSLPNIQCILSNFLLLDFYIFSLLPLLLVAIIAIFTVLSLTLLCYEKRTIFTYIKCSQVFFIIFITTVEHLNFTENSQLLQIFTGLCKERTLFFIDKANRNY